MYLRRIYIELRMSRTLSSFPLWIPRRIAWLMCVLLVDDQSAGEKLRSQLETSWTVQKPRLLQCMYGVLRVTTGIPVAENIRRIKHILEARDAMDNWRTTR